MMPASSVRVPQHTPEKINEKIRRQTEANITYYAAGGLNAIDQRLMDLDYEWDIERTLEANAATFSLLGLTLGMTVNRRWLLLPTAVAGFLLQHAVQGWCPPVSVFRRMGIRTRTEIDFEKYALKALRGDFQNLPTMTEGAQGREDVRQVLEAVHS